MVVGLTVIAAVVADVLHRYVPPPLAVSVVLCPLQMVALVGLIAAVGALFTVTDLLAVAVQPLAFVTVTV